MLFELVLARWLHWTGKARYKAETPACRIGGESGRHHGVLSRIDLG
jgi:hypothetical protein